MGKRILLSFLFGLMNFFLIAQVSYYPAHYFKSPSSLVSFWPLSIVDRPSAGATMLGIASGISSGSGYGFYTMYITRQGDIDSTSLGATLPKMMSNNSDSVTLYKLFPDNSIIGWGKNSSGRFEVLQTSVSSTSASLEGKSDQYDEYAYDKAGTFITGYQDRGTGTRALVYASSTRRMYYQIKSANTNKGYAIVHSIDSNYVIAGTTYTNSGHTSGAFVMKVDQGALMPLWCQTLTKVTSISTIVQSKFNDHLVLCGTEFRNNPEVFLAAFNGGGKLLWKKSYALGLPFISAQMFQDSATGHYIVVGNAIDYQNDTITACVFRTDTAGNFLWGIKVLQGNANTTCQIAQTAPSISGSSGNNIFLDLVDTTEYSCDQIAFSPKVSKACFSNDTTTNIRTSTDVGTGLQHSAVSSITIREFLPCHPGGGGPPGVTISGVDCPCKAEKVKDLTEKQ